MSLRSQLDKYQSIFNLQGEAAAVQVPYKTFTDEMINFKFSFISN